MCFSEKDWDLCPYLYKSQRVDGTFTQFRVYVFNRINIHSDRKVFSLSDLNGWLHIRPVKRRNRDGEGETRRGWFLFFSYVSLLLHTHMVLLTHSLKRPTISSWNPFRRLSWTLKSPGRLHYSKEEYRHNELDKN